MERGRAPRLQHEGMRKNKESLEHCDEGCCDRKGSMPAMVLVAVPMPSLLSGVTSGADASGADGLAKAHAFVWALTG